LLCAALWPVSQGRRLSQSARVSGFDQNAMAKCARLAKLDGETPRAGRIEQASLRPFRSRKVRRINENT
jgi:uncharacterized protein (UPF0335 family)